jgi:hypothetical protein
MPMRRSVSEEAEPPEAIRPVEIEPHLRAVVDVLDQGAARRLRLRLAGHWPWAGELTAAVTRLQALPSG